MKKIMTVLFVAGLTCASQADVIGNFEDAGLDGWTPATATLSQSTTAGTVTLDSYSLSVHKPDNSGYWELTVNLPAPSFAPTQLSFDLTMIASEWVDGSEWTKVADKISLNSDGPSGWTEWLSTDAGRQVIDRNTLAPAPLDWGPWYGDSQLTMIQDVSAYDATGATWFQVNISIQQNDGLLPTPAGNFYIDNVQLIPEPGTLGLIGLGMLGLAVRRRRR